MPFKFDWPAATIDGMWISGREVTGNATWSSVLTGIPTGFGGGTNVASIKTEKMTSGRTTWRKNWRLHVQMSYNKNLFVGGQNVPVNAILHNATWIMYRTNALHVDDKAFNYRIYKGTWTATPAAGLANPYNQFTSTVYAQARDMLLASPYNPTDNAFFKFTIDNNAKMLEYFETQLANDDVIRLTFRNECDWGSSEPTGINRTDIAGSAYTLNGSTGFRPTWSTALGLPTTPHFGSTF